MAEIDELKKIWQAQKIEPDKEKIQEKVLNGMIDELSRFEKKQGKRTILKTIGITLVL